MMFRPVSVLPHSAHIMQQRGRVNHFPGNPAVFLEVLDPSQSGDGQKMLHIMAAENPLCFGFSEFSQQTLIQGVP